MEGSNNTDTTTNTTTNTPNTTGVMLGDLKGWVEKGWVEDTNAKEGIKGCLEAGEDANEWMVRGLHNTIKNSEPVKSKIEEFEKVQELKVKTKKFNKEWMDKIKGEWDERENTTTPYRAHLRYVFMTKKTKNADGEESRGKDGEAVKKIVIRPNGTFTPEIINTAILKILEERDEWVENKINPAPIKKYTSGGGGGGKKDESADTICHQTYTQEWAENQYESLSKGFCMKYDFDNKSVSKIGKKYKVGQKHPVTGVELENPLYVYSYAPLIRDKSFMDASDDNRCQGSVAWKQGRYSKDSFASKCGITGAVSYQCANTQVEGGFCAKCANKSKCLDFFDMKYPKTSWGTDIPYENFWSGDSRDDIECEVMDLSDYVEVSESD